jgi:predicted AAA+ superfamily ATPase
LFHSFLQITGQETLDGFYAKCSSRESFVIQQIIARLNEDTEAYFYRTQDVTELDLVLVKGLRVAAGIEIKLTNAPHPTRGITLAYRDLGSPPIWILTHSAGEDYAINDSIPVTSFELIFNHLDKLKLIS